MTLQFPFSLRLMHKARQQWSEDIGDARLSQAILALLCRFVPMGMIRGAISGFVLMIVSAAGTWAVYGRPQAA